MEEKVSVWKANLTNGLILGLIGIVYSLVVYFFDLTLNKVQGYVFLVILIVALYFLIKSYRDNHLHGQMTYGQAVGAGMVIFLYYSFITAIFTWILFAVIDPGLIDKQIAFAEELLQKRGLPQEAMDAAMRVQQKMINPEIEKAIKQYSGKAKAWKLSGAGGGGYLILISEEEIPNSFKVKIRLKELGL